MVSSTNVIVNKTKTASDGSTHPQRSDHGQVEGENRPAQQEDAHGLPNIRRGYPPATK
jgi:hypothetical protein